MQPKHYKHVTDRITMVKCNAATCLIRPQHVGPKPDLIRQVSLYLISWPNAPQTKTIFTCRGRSQDVSLFASFVCKIHTTSNANNFCIRTGTNHVKVHPIPPSLLLSNMHYSVYYMTDCTGWWCLWYQTLPHKCKRMGQLDYLSIKSRMSCRLYLWEGVEKQRYRSSRYTPCFGPTSFCWQSNNYSL